MKIVFVTSNAGKLKEIKQFLEPLGFEIVNINIDLTEIQASQREVVKHKALQARKHVKEALVVEDTGFYIDCYKDFPGVYARHVVTAIGSSGIQKLVDGMDRKAHFLSIAAFLPENVSQPILFEGECTGVISDRQTTMHHPKLPYDSIFVPENLGKTFGELSVEEKNKLSHRCKAFEKLATYLRENK